MEKEYWMLPRRSFIKRMGMFAGVTMLPSCSLGGAHADKEGCPKVKVVFVNHLDDVQMVPDWPNVGYDFRPSMENILLALNARIKDVLFIAAYASNDAQSKEIVETDGNEIAGYVVVQMTCQDHALDGIATAKKPILYVSHPYAGDGAWVQFTTKYLNEGQPYFAYISTLNVKDVAKMASAFSKLNGGTPDDFLEEAERLRKEIVPTQCKAKAVKDSLKCLTVEETLAKVKGKKILSIANDNPDMFAKIKEAFGMECQVVTFKEFSDVFSTIGDAEAEAQVEAWKEKAAGVYDVRDEDMLDAAKSYLTQKALLTKYDACALTMNCLGGCYSGAIKGYPCLGFMKLQDEGLMGVCENDLSSTSTMLVFQAMTGRTGLVSDPVLDFSNRSIIYAHCVSTTKFLGQDGPQSKYEIMTHSEDRKGASVRVTAPVEYPVTTVLLDIYRNRLTIHTGVITGNSTDDRACRTKMVVEVTGDYDKLHRNWYIWHRVTFLGDFAKEAEALGKKIGYEVIYES